METNLYALAKMHRISDCGCPTTTDTFAAKPLYPRLKENQGRRGRKSVRARGAG